MIQVFCARRGSGKTKRLIELANHQQAIAKGDSVYIDDDSKYEKWVITLKDDNIPIGNISL